MTDISRLSEIYHSRLIAVTDAPLFSLPNEILLLIVQTLFFPADIDAFARSSRFLYDLINPELYKYSATCFGDSALTFAVQWSRVDTARQALKNGADPEALICPFCRHPVSRPVEPTGDTIIVKRRYPFYRGCRCEAQGIELSTAVSALQSAVRSRRPELVELLLRRGAPPDIDHGADDDLDRPLVLSATHGDYRCVDLLLDYFVNLAAMRETAELALWYAAQQGNKHTTNLLLTKAKADPTRVRVYDETALCAAIVNGHRETAKELLAYGALNQESEPPRNTPLNAATRNGDGELIELLLDLGADVHDRDIEGNTPMMYAAIRGDIVNCRRFLKRGFDPEHEVYMRVDCQLKHLPLHAAATTASVEVATILLSVSRGEIERRPWLAGHCLRAAAGRGHLPMVKLLLDHGASLHEEDEVGNTALWEAAKGGYFHVAQMLLEAGASADWLNHLCQTPLWPAIDNADIAIIVLLADATSDRDCRDISGDTPMLVAAVNDHKDIAVLLLERGFDPYVIQPYEIDPF